MQRGRIALLSLALLLVGCVQPGRTPSTPAAATPAAVTPAPSAIPPGPTPAAAAEPRVSPERLLATISDLTGIQAHSGWRNSGTTGEQEALDYLEARLQQFAFLTQAGLRVAREPFAVFIVTEIWETELRLTIGERTLAVPADGLRGERESIPLALHFDSDGQLNDDLRNPRTVEGGVVLVRDAEDLGGLAPGAAEGQILLVDDALVDRVVRGTETAIGAARSLLAARPAGIVLVTSYSNRPGESHGTFAGEGGVFAYIGEPLPPILLVRLEDLLATGVEGWEGLALARSARLVWDADVFSPGQSANLVAHIPGKEPGAALILGAHIDSPNSPGALDDASGSAVLLEVAHLLDENGLVPPVDLYLVWFGSEELGLYGSSHFVATHQELLDRTVAMLQIDCLSRPLDGIDAHLTLETWSYGRLGDDRLPWPETLAELERSRGLALVPEASSWIASDNSSFAAYNVPNANLIYMDTAEMDAQGGVHYAGHLHDPYDTSELAAQMGDVLVQMAQVALDAALTVPPDPTAFRTVPTPEQRALFVGSHTEPAHMAPTWLVDLGMALGMEGYDVDLIPYGDSFGAAELEDAAFVVALPVADYASSAGSVDEAWTEEEISALENYVTEGGLLVLTNSAHRLKYTNRVLDANEDWPGQNDLAARFGVRFLDEPIAASEARVTADHPLVAGIQVLALARGNALSFEISSGQVLARADERPVVALVPFGKGEVLVLGDLGLLGSAGEPLNLRFWRSLGSYARSRSN